MSLEQLKTLFRVGDGTYSIVSMDVDYDEHSKLRHRSIELYREDNPDEEVELMLSIFPRYWKFESAYNLETGKWDVSVHCTYSPEQPITSITEIKQFRPDGPILEAWSDAYMRKYGSELVMHNHEYVKHHVNRILAHLFDKFISRGWKLVTISPQCNMLQVYRALSSHLVKMNNTVSTNSYAVNLTFMDNPLFGSAVPQIDRIAINIDDRWYDLPSFKKLLVDLDVPYIGESTKKHLIKMIMESIYTYFGVQHEK